MVPGGAARGRPRVRDGCARRRARNRPLEMAELVCHPDTPSHAVTGIAVHATRTTERKLALHYSVSGQIAKLRVPPPGLARIGWKLWRHTCCELFVREKGGAGYHEFNFAPSGE